MSDFIIGKNNCSTLIVLNPLCFEATLVLMAGGMMSPSLNHVFVIVHGVL